MFHLSRNYQKAFELIQRGDRLVCLVDYEDCRDVAIARWNNQGNRHGSLVVGARGIAYLYFFEDQLETNDLFIEHCDRLNVEFYLPVAD